MKGSVLNSLFAICLLLTACSPSILKGFQKTEAATVLKDGLYPFFSKDDTLHHFNMQIDFRKNHFSGLLIIKQTAEDTYRLVLNSHFGMGIFNLELTPQTFTVHHCLEALNKKQVINTLENDFRNLLFLQVPEAVPADTYKDKTDPSRKIYRIKPDKDKQYYLVNDSLKELQQMEIPHFFSGLRYEFTDYNNRFPGKIVIRHSNIGLTMKFEKIKLPDLSHLGENVAISL